MAKTKAELSLTWSQVLAWRMRKNLLTTPTPEIVDISRQLLGVQAQVMSSAELALSIRGKRIHPIDVQKALWTDRSLLKTWTVRGTLHLITPDDLPLFAGAMQARGDYWNKPAWLRYQQVSSQDMERVIALTPQALEGKCLTRKELSNEVARLARKKDLAEHMMKSWGGLLKPLAFRGQLCFGPSNGRNVTFVRPQDWVGAHEEIDSKTALETLLFRYLDTYGPATISSFTRWLGVEPKIARATVNAAIDRLVTVDVDGTAMWTSVFAAKDLQKKSNSHKTALLPAFDPYIVGVLEQVPHLVADPSLRSRVSRTAGWISPTMIVDGRIVGVWRHERRARSFDITFDSFEKLDPALETAFEKQRTAMQNLLRVVPEDDQ